MTGGASKIDYIKNLNINIMIDDQAELFNDVFEKDQSGLIEQCQFIKILRIWNKQFENQHLTFDQNTNNLVK